VIRRFFAFALSVALVAPAAPAYADPVDERKNATGAASRTKSDPAPYPDPNSGSGVGRVTETASAPTVWHDTSASETAPPREWFTPTTRFRRNDNGTVTAEIRGGTAYRRDGHGGWMATRASLAQGKDARWPFAANEGYRPVRFGRSADAVLELALPGGTVTFATPGLAIRPPVAVGREPRYRDVATDTDLVFEPGAGGVKQRFVLRSANAPRRFRFHIADPDGALGDVTRDADGSYRFARSLGDGVYVTLPPAVAYEQSAGELGGAPGSAHLTVTQVRGGFDVVESVDEEWLRGKTFPVVLDPTVTFKGSAHYDCYVVSDNYATQGNCGAGAVMTGHGLGGSPLGTCGTGSPQWCITRGLIRPDVSTLPRGADVTAASLRMWQFDNQTGASFNVGLYNNNHWFNNSATWNRWDNACASPCWSGGMPGGYQDDAAVNATDGYRTWNLSGPHLVESWRNGLSTAGGLITRANPEARTSIGTTGHVVGFYSNTVADSTKWPLFTVTYTPPPAPVVSKTVAPAPGYTTSVNGSYARGSVARYTVAATSAVGQDDVTLKDTVPAGITVLPETITVDNVACPTCLSGNVITKSLLDYTASQTHTLRYDALLTGSDERDCVSPVNTAVATTPSNTTSTDTVTVVICDIGLGIEPWWSYFSRPVAHESAALVNAGNGNLVVQQQDGTVIQGRGRIAYGLRRTYNSQDTRLLALPGSLPSNWQLNFGEVSDNGISPSGLVVPPLTTLSKTLPVTLVDRDGTRHVFTARATSTPLHVMRLDTTSSPAAMVPASGTLGPLVPSVLGKSVNLTSFNAVCVDVGYTGPPGVHLSLWRYVALNNTGAADTCTQGAGTTAPVLLGYATERTDRYRNEFSWSGQLLSQLDAAGNELRYAYVGGLPLAGGLLGKLSTVYEPSECTEAQATASGSTCRSFRMTYNGSGMLATVTDPAGRVTTYGYDTTPGFPQLTRVTNPDGSFVQYSYFDGDAATCTVTGQTPQRGQLCSITDERGTKTSFRYYTTTAGQPGRLHSIIDRRNTNTTFTYAADASSTEALVNSAQKRSWKLLDSRGRAGQIVDSQGTTMYHQTDFTWDSTGCRKPSGGTDNNVCRTVRKAFNDSQTGQISFIDTVDGDTSYTYNDEGQRLSESRVLDATTSLVTTSGYRAIYVQRTGTATADDVVAGGGTVNSGARPAASGVLYVLSDRTQSLTARGNEPSLATWADHLTTYRVENNPSARPNTAPPAPTAPADPRDAVFCTQADPTQPVTNTGLVCQIEGPSWNGTDATITRYAYDHFGAKRTATSPEAIARAGSSTPQATTYTYYDSGTTDLSGLTSAAGWLKGVTDPYGKFVAFGYDRAGNVIRTWDRNATARGLALSGANTLDTYPGNGVGGYAEARYGPYPGGASAASAPWRFKLADADALGNLTTYVVDAHGHQRTIRPPRGNAAGNADYDTTQEFSGAGDMTSRITPEGRIAGNQAARWTYDAYGNVFTESSPLAHPDYPTARTDDPTGNTKRFLYDGANRLVYVFWSRNPLTEPSSGACSSAGLGAPLSANHWGCYESKQYDGLDNNTSVYDAEHRLTRMHYDAVGREVRRDIARSGTLTVRAEKRYDRDGNVLRECSPREFDSAEPGAALACVAGGQYTKTYAYDAAGRRSQMETRRGTTTFVTEYAYNADGVQVSEEGPEGGVQQFTVDLLGRRTRASVLRGTTFHHTDITFDAVGNTTSVTKPGGRITAYSYDAANRPVDTVEGASDVNASAAGATSADGGSNIRSSVRYDADGHVVARIEPRAFRTATGAPATTVPSTTHFMVRYDYDKDGRVVAEYRPRYDADGADSSTEFDDLGITSSQSSQCTTSIRPAAVAGNPQDLPAYDADTAVCAVRRSWDSDGRMTQLRLPTSNGSDNRYLGYTYTNDDLLAQVSAPNPNPSLNPDPNASTGAARITVETRRYDAENRPLSVTRAAPVAGGTPWTATVTYTFDGLVTQATEGTATHVTTFGYDANGNRTMVQDALGRQTVGTYYSDDKLKELTDPNQKKTSYTYDGVGNTTDVVAPNLQGTGLSVHNTFTTDNLLDTTTEPVSTAGNGERRRTTYGYDAGGRKTSVLVDKVDAASNLLESGGTQAFAYYPSDRPSTETGRNGETITRTYDAAGHPAVVSNVPVSGPTVTTTVQSYFDGLVKSVTQSGRTTSYAYDAAGGLVLRDVYDGGHTYNTFAYGDAGQLTTVTSDLMGTGAQVGVVYDMAGRETTRTNPNGTTVSRTYNTDDTLATQQLAPTSNLSSPIAAWTYGYDALARVTMAARDASGTPSCPAESPVALPAAGVQCFYYDLAGRLHGFRDSSGDKLIEYDGNGNRTRYGTTTYQYNLDNTIKWDSTVGSQYAYDAVGRTKSDGVRYHCYDGFDRLAEARTGATSCTGSVTNGVTYTYDGLDRQVTRYEVGAGAVVPGTTTQHYDGLDSTLLAEVSPQSTTAYLQVEGLPAYVTRSGTGATSQYLTDDGRGNVSTATTTASTGTLACSVRYDAFGSPIGGQSGSNACSTGSTPSSILYAGQRRDAVSGTYQLGARTYDPGKAGFLTPDVYRSGAPEQNLSIGSDPMTANRYAYVNGDPVNYIDPDGHAPTRWIGVGCDEATECTPQAVAERERKRRAEEARRKAAARGLGTAQRIQILQSFFGAHPGSGEGRGYGYGFGLIEFTQWEIDSGRIGEFGDGSPWWRTVNGMMLLDIQEAHRLIQEQGPDAVSADPVVNAWIDYARVADSSAKPGTKQRALWQAHQRSLHRGIRASGDLLAKETSLERHFVGMVVENVDVSAFINFSSDMSIKYPGMPMVSMGAYLQMFYPSVYPAVPDQLYTAKQSRIRPIVEASNPDGYLTAIFKNLNLGLESTLWG
jgi:RHS repeat-associated protein